jgi:predicted ATPase/class 3 adenylate cyclase
MGDLPGGTVTFLFSDVEGSTQLLERHGRLLADALSRHHRLLADAVERHGGTIFETVGDAAYAVFVDPTEATAAAVDIHTALAVEDWGPIGRLAARIAIHTGHVERLGRHYSGPALFRAARLQAIGHGEQTLLSEVTAQLVLEALPPGARLRSLGKHRLKDLTEPEEVHQLVHPALRDSFPPLKSVGAHPSNLPEQVSSFVGRATEVTDIVELLDRHRLVTLVGPGGIGKTRLALEVAALRLERHADGAWFVDLSGASDASVLSAALAAALGLREIAGRSVAEVVAEHLDGRDALVVLDNLEQLLPDAAGHVAQLLGATQEVTILATSRAPLRLRGEQVLIVPPLATGAGEPRSPAVALFRERARSIGRELPDDEATLHLIAEICDLCDGLPLAIELAAARLSVFDVADLRARLAQRLPLLIGGARDAPVRQQTLSAAIAWSVDLMATRERRLFALLGVFVGGFDLDAVEAVAAEVPGIDPTSALAELVAQSLVQRPHRRSGQTRYAMLETIRQYALESLDDSQREIAFERHAQWLVQRARTLLSTPVAPDRDAFDQMSLDLENIRAAYQRPITDTTRLALASATWWMWHVLGLLEEGLRWTEDALAGHPAPSPDRVLALRGAAVIRSSLGDDGGLAMAADALDLARRLCDDRLTADSLNTLGALDPDPDRATKAFLECIELGKRSGRPMAGPHINLGWTAGLRGEMEAAVEWYRKGLEVSRTAGDHGAAAASLTGLAWLALIRGDADEASAHAAAAYQAGWQSGEPLWCAEALVQLARADLERGRLQSAAQRLLAAYAELEHGEWVDARESTLACSGRLMLLAGMPDRAATLLGAARSAAAADRSREQVTGVWNEIDRATQADRDRALDTGPGAIAAHAYGQTLEPGEAIRMAAGWLSDWLASEDRGSPPSAE